ncbi:MAG TPA: fasciclin domain-containing protein [Paludibacter sp.]|nr:fasciclin domain-containing protein [Paludibacter sp.]
MKFKYLGFSLVATLIVAFSAVSCSDVWDEHYFSEPQNKSNLNLYQYISADTTLTKFTQMLRITHYDSILSQSSSYTVWAPTNASLEYVDFTDTAEVYKIVGNHVTRFSYSTSMLEGAGKLLRMFDKKLLLFEKTAGGFTFGGMPVVKPDLATKNGIVHILGVYVPYTFNFWEFIDQQPGLDSLKVFLNSLNTKIYDPALSFQDGVFVDSVFRNSNVILDNVAALNTEDSIYTAILPTDYAWAKAYEQIAPYFNFLPDDGGEAARRKYAKLYLLKDLFFRGKLSFPLTTSTLKSTLGTKYSNPSELFDNSMKFNLSNGLACVSYGLTLRPTESWFDTLRFEAESATFKTNEKANYDTYIYSGVGSGYDISGGKYLYLKDVAVNGIRAPYAVFELPNTLSAAYNIYCVFAPTKMISSGDERPNKVKFFLSYVDASGKQIYNAAIDTTHQVLAGKTASTIDKFPTTDASTIFTTNPTKVDKVLVAQNVVFPFCNLLTLQNDKTTVSLAVVNAVGFKPADQLLGNRSLLIDYIILEPVVQ